MRSGILIWTSLLAFVLQCGLSFGAGDPGPENDPDSPKKVVLIAGEKSHGPVGNGIHDYPWSVKLLKVMLDNSNIRDRVRVEFHLDGWPEDPATLEDADTIMIVSDGRDGDRYREAPHFQSPERAELIARQMARGCGFMTFHFSTFAPDRYAEEILDWSGGYFDWETDGERDWYSAIETIEAEVRPAAPGHPVLRGVEPFRMKEEFYYNIRFRPDDERLTPLWTVPALDGRQPNGSVVAWARQREDGGRGFGTTCGHFYDNWKYENFRRMILNAIAWTAGVEVAEGGVEAEFFTREEITSALQGVEGTEPAVLSRSENRLLPGRFGQALNAARGGHLAEANAEFGHPPLTVELWIRLIDGRGERVLVANGLRGSRTYWDLLVDEDRTLRVNLSGFEPGTVRADRNLRAETWHFMLESFVLRDVIDFPTFGRRRMSVNLVG